LTDGIKRNIIYEIGFLRSKAMNFLFVFIGGGTGALCRYLTTQAETHIFTDKFLFGTVVVNCIGALIIGFIINIFGLYSLDIKWKLLFVTGFLGGYTTFSAYALESANYFLAGNIKYAILNIVLSNVLCIAFVFAGMWLYKIIFVR
jgi:CrcB protein